MHDENQPGRRGLLYVAATPIGNLEDITLRAARILREVTLIGAEDTRHASVLLRHLGATARVIAYHDHNEQRASEEILRHLASGHDAAIISDAGTPAISDPGSVIVARAAAEGYTVHPLPGPSALTATLSIAGLPPQPILFLGFLPAKAGERKKILGSVANLAFALAFYEAPHRIHAFLADANEILGGSRPCVCARELTKLHETIVHGPLAEVCEQLRSLPPKGEYVVVVGKPEQTPVAEQDTLSDEQARVLEAIKRGAKTSELAGILSAYMNLPRRTIYRALAGERE